MSWVGVVWVADFCIILQQSGTSIRSIGHALQGLVIIVQLGNATYGLPFLKCSSYSLRTIAALHDPPKRFQKGQIQ